MQLIARQMITEIAQDLERFYQIKPDNQWLDLLLSSDFESGLASLLKEDCYRSLELLELFMPSADKKALELWRDGIYQYLLSLTYPDNATIPDLPDFKSNALIFLELYRQVSIYEREYGNTDFVKDYPFELLTEAEYQALEDKREYGILRNAFRFDYIYELMKLNREIFPYTSLEHITGVHYLALFIARQLKEKGIAIDLGIVSGAAAVHDIGKFGCKPEESRKVAYYHYYYTEEWCYRKRLDYIRNIAVNHSTWDLELESLSIESMVLIYSDFRVKEAEVAPPRPMKFYDLAESFAVILHKLDNVDSAKELRYQKVYNKLADFEKYLVSLGVRTSFSALEPILKPESAHAYHLKENIDELKLSSFKHSFAAMHSLRSENSLLELLDKINNCDSSLEISRYFTLLGQFSLYLTPKQKLLLLNFLFEYLVETEENRRYQAVDLMAEIITSFDAPYSKYLPPSVDEDIYKVSKAEVLKGYCQRFLAAKGLSATKSTRLAKALAKLFKAVIQKSPNDFAIIDILLSLIENSKLDLQIYLLESFYEIELADFMKAHLDRFALILERMLKKQKSQEFAAYTIYKYAYVGFTPIDELAFKIIDRKYHLGNEDLFRLLCLKESGEQFVRQKLDYQFLALNNLKRYVPVWQKLLNLDIIAQIVANDSEDYYYWIAHLINLVKLSSAFEVRQKAAKLLSIVFPKLNTAEKNDVVCDLLSGMESDNYSKTLPAVIGDLISKLRKEDSCEVLDDLNRILESGFETKKIMVLETVSYTLKSWLRQPGFNLASEEANRALAVLFRGLVQHQQAVQVAAFNAFSSNLFSSYDYLEARYQLLERFLQKFILIMERLPEKLSAQSLNYAHGYNSIYAFLIEYRHEIGDYKCDKKVKVAYFTGSFDPFSLGQKEIVAKLAKNAYDVYIDFDKLQWQRKTQALLLRRRLLELSIADLPSVYLMRTLPVIDRSSDKVEQNLKQLLNAEEVDMVVGEDAVLKQDIYQDKNTAIKKIPHVIIGRNKRCSKKLLEKMEEFDSAKYMSADLDVTQITPKMIRKALNQGEDISDMVDIFASREIAKRNLYRNEPTFKTDVISTANTSILKAPLEPELVAEIKVQFVLDVSEYLNKRKQYIFINRNLKTGKINAVAIYSALIEEEYQKLRRLETIKRNYSELYLENTIKIEFLLARKAKDLENHWLALHTEILVHAHNHGYEYALYQVDKNNKQVERHLEMTGYIDVTKKGDYLTVFKKPVVIILDAQSAFKDSYRKEPTLRKAIAESRQQLLHALSKERAGIAILAFDRRMLYDKINSIIKNINAPKADCKWGKYICVPFGDIYRQWLLPDSVTKTLHTERLYDSSLSYYQIVEKPDYHNVYAQIEIIKAFQKPVLLIDDIVHKGLRLSSLEEDFKSLDVSLAAVVAGISTRMGRSRVINKGYSLHSGYFLNQIESWYVESSLYPFIGGDAVEKEQTQDMAIASVNNILPYKLPVGARQHVLSVARFSDVCLRQCLNILLAIEQVYFRRNKRSLTAKNLSEVFLTARVPENYQHLLFNQAALPSQIIAKDLVSIEQLLQLL